jgi:hypothetical protein
MDDPKLQSKIYATIEKINSKSFDTSTLTDFYSAVRWSDANKNWPLTFEISNFVAHHKRDKGYVLEKITSMEIISNFIEEENFNQAKSVNALKFPQYIFEAILDIHGTEIKKYYALDKKNKFYNRNKKPDPSGKVLKYLQNVFYTIEFQKPLIDSNEIYSDFFGSLNFHAGIFKINRLKPVDLKTKNEIILCILSVLSSTSIETESSITVKPKFKLADGLIQLRYGYPFKNPAVSFTLEGATLDFLFCSGKFEADDLKFSEHSSDLIRSESGDLFFVRCN